jgi:hypothetical protein
MARILIREYCFELAGASTLAGSDCVLVMSSALRGTLVRHIVRRVEIATSGTTYG